MQHLLLDKSHFITEVTYSGDLAEGVVEYRTIMNFDGLLYLMGIPMMLVTFLLLGINTVIFLADGMTASMLIFNYLKYIVATFIAPMFTAILIMIIEKKPIRKMIKGILAYPLFLGSWILINLKCIVKPDTKWEKIEHKVNVKIDDVKTENEKKKKNKKEKKETE